MSVSECSDRKSLKRRRTDSSTMEGGSSDADDVDHSLAWNDPSILEEMGVGMLSEDSPLNEEVNHEEQSEHFMFPIPSSEDDCTENMELKEMKPTLKKQKLSEQNREPFKERLVTNTATSNPEVFITLSPHKKKGGGAPDVITSKNCDVKKDKSSKKCGKKTSNINNNITDTEKSVCNDEFKLNPVRRRSESFCGPNYFSTMPDELILGIFQYLDHKSVVQCRLVSKQFLRVANDEALWVRADLSGRNFSREVLTYMLLRRCYIVRLASACIAYPVIDHSALPWNFTSNIQYLDLSMAAISARGLASLLRYCRKIRKLSLENCELSDAVCSAIARSKGLEVLNLAMCSGITSDGLNCILTKCERLQALNLGWTHLSVEALEDLAENVPRSVERLNISGCRYNLTNKDVIKIFQRCDNLLELDISDCTDLTEKVIEGILKDARGLEYLAISRCYSIPLSCLRSLKKVESLTYLDLFGLCSQAELKRIREELDEKTLNQFHFSSVARPTVGVRRTSIWGLRVRD